jgi:hypothetical protein
MGQDQPGIDQPAVHPTRPDVHDADADPRHTLLVYPLPDEHAVP